MGQIGLVPVGRVEPGLLEFLRFNLEEYFQKKVLLCQPLDEPTYAYDAKRKQCRSTAILDQLIGYGKGVCECALGVVSIDLFVPGLTFVFGEADLVNQVAVISLARLDQRFYGLPEDNNLFFERALKEAIHELGHTYGLRHCQDVECIMFFSTSLADTDRKKPAFCPRCEKKYKLKLPLT